MARPKESRSRVPRSMPGAASIGSSRAEVFAASGDEGSEGIGISVQVGCFPVSGRRGPATTFEGFCAANPAQLSIFSFNSQGGLSLPDGPGPGSSFGTGRCAAELAARARLVRVTSYVYDTSTVAWRPDRALGFRRLRCAHGFRVVVPFREEPAVRAGS